MHWFSMMSALATDRLLNGDVAWVAIQSRNYISEVPPPLVVYFER